MPVSLRSLASALALSSLAAAHLGHEVVHRQLPGDWWQHERAEVVNLFKRQDTTSAPIGSPQFIAMYPPLNGVPDANVSAIPAAWLAAYNASKNAGHIPDIPVTTIPPTGGNPVYPAGFVGTDPKVCTATLKCFVASDVVNAPDGVIGISFDDGPVAVAPILYQFLRDHNVPSTHFMIGRVILGDLVSFQIAYGQNQASIAVHTWSHPMMTTQTDLQQVAEIGWTMQLIHDITGGRVPRFWRPPLGDCDLRCRAIAETVFNLTTVFWNKDSEDWRLSLGQVTGPEVIDNITDWVNGPKSPGIIILEHELTNDTINIWMNTTYPLALKNNWTMMNIPQLLHQDYYQNAANDVGAPTASLPIALAPSDAVAASGAASGTLGGSGAAIGPSGTSAAPGGSATPGAAPAGARVAAVLGALGVALGAVVSL